MKARTAATSGAVFGFLAVAFGAFGAHSLRSALEPRMLEVFETGARYQMYHAFALLVSAWLISREIRAAHWAAIAFTTGIVLFSGSLYLMALTGWLWLGPITPLGGVAFLTGWIMLAIAARKL